MSTVPDFTPGQTIDPDVDPAAAQAAVDQLLSEANAPAVAHPEVAPVADDRVELPGGYLTSDGTVVKQAIVREMTGLVEEEIEKPGVRENAWRFVQTLLNHCLVSVGDMKVPSPGFAVDDLLDGDAITLAIAVRVLTYGQTMDVDGLVCPTCAHQFDITYDVIKDVTTRPLDGGPRLFDVELKHGKKAKLQLPTLGDQLFASSEVNVAERGFAARNNALLGRCVKSIGDQPVFNADAVRNLPAQDGRTLIKFIYETQAGPRLADVQQQCPNCRNSFPLVLSVIELFR